MYIGLLTHDSELNLSNILRSNHGNGQESRDIGCVTDMLRTTGAGNSYSSCVIACELYLSLFPASIPF